VIHHWCHWQCPIGQPLADPLYFSPPASPNGEVPLQVVAYHASLPKIGWTFKREGLGQPWKRIL
jgi:hypothetical protein